MLYEFFFENNYYISIHEVSVIGKFNRYNPKANLLKRCNDGWRSTIDMPKGRQDYKFLINGILRLNDYKALQYQKNKEGEMWSVVDVGRDKAKSYMETERYIELYNHALTGRILDDITGVNNRSYFCADVDSYVYTGYSFGNIAGIHTVTAIWVKPDLSMHHISEHVIEVNEGDINNATDVWFWLNLKEKQRDISKGIWQVKLFVNGEFFLEDRFHYGTGYLYSISNKRIELKYM